MNGQARQAARTVTAAKLAVPTAAVGLILLTGLGVLQAVVGHTAAAVGDSCGTPGLPSAGGAAPADGDLLRQQLANARIVDRAATTAGLPGQATLIGLMTALQESTLLDLDHGDADSVGLFQQRPSAGWGTREQLLDPAFAAREFFTGGRGGSPRGLADVPDWQSMAPGDAAQAVQHSAYPELYAGQEQQARAIAAAADIDLDRGGTPRSPSPPSGGDCYAAEPSAAAGTTFSDGGGRLNGENPRPPDAAIAWAEDQTDSSVDWYRQCLAFVARAYGWRASNDDSAMDLWNESAARHAGDRRPPIGALLFWRSRTHAAGHVALYIGGGRIVSTDILRAGRVDIAAATAPETRWNDLYLGWTAPVFPHGAT